MNSGIIPLPGNAEHSRLMGRSPRRRLLDRAVAWVVFDGRTGSTATVKASYNVARVVRDATGRYTITWEYEQADEWYAFSGVCRTVTGVGYGLVTESDLAPSRTTAALKIKTIGFLSAGPSLAEFDSDLISVILLGQ